MATRYTYDTNLNDEAETEVRVSFTVAWGSPGTGRPYFGPVELYDEGSPDEVEDMRLLLVDGSTGPFDEEFIAAALQEVAVNHTEAMLEEARQREAAWAE